MMDKETWAAENGIDMDAAGKIKFPCCFCGLDVKEPVFDFTVGGVGYSQTWWGHLRCFIGHLHPDFRYVREEWDEYRDQVVEWEEIPPGQGF